MKASVQGFFSVAGMAEPSHAQAIAEENVRCPDGMPRDVFLQLKKPYDQACDRVRKGANFSEATQEKNKKKLEAAKKLLLEQLNHFKVNPELRSLIAAGNATSQSILQFLNTNYSALDTRLGTMQASLTTIAKALRGSQSSSSSPELMDVDPCETCLICYDSVKAHPVQPVCCMGENREVLHAECAYRLAIRTDVEFQCPRCRSGAAAIPFAVSATAWLHENLRSFQASEVVPLKALSKCSFADFHFKICCTKKADDATLLQLDLGARAQPMTLRLHEVAVEGDEIFTFLSEKTGGRWPLRGKPVELTFKGLSSKLWYDFMYFERSVDDAVTYAVMQMVGTGEAEDVSAKTLVALQDIATFKEWAPVTDDWVADLAFEISAGQEVLLKLIGHPWGLFQFKRCMLSSIGPKMILTKVFDITVYAGQLQSELIETFSHRPDSDLVPVYSMHGYNIMPIPSVIIVTLKETSSQWRKDLFKAKFGSTGELTFFGYGQSCGNPFMHCIRDEHHMSLDVSDILNVRFVRAGQGQ